MSNKPCPEQYPGAYFEGRSARQEGRDLLCQPHGHMTVDSGWWCAGWHDLDMDLTREVKTKGAATAATATNPIAA